jgi:hypothetical protein
MEQQAVNADRDMARSLYQVLSADEDLKVDLLELVSTTTST